MATLRHRTDMIATRLTPTASQAQALCRVVTPQAAVALAIAVQAMIYVVALLVWINPPDLFWVGDPGTIFFQLLAWSRYGLSHDLPYPGIAQDPTMLALPISPELIAIRDHAIRIVFEPGLSLVSVIPYRLAGAYGLYLATIAAGVGLAAITMAHYVKLKGRLDYMAPLVGLIAGTCTPVFFFGITWWSVAPSAFFIALGLYLMVHDAGSPGRAGAAGFALGLAALFRPDVLIIGTLAIPLISLICLRERPMGSKVRHSLLLACGMLIGASPVILYSLVAFGSLIPQHVLVQAHPNAMWGNRLSYSISRIVEDTYTLTLRFSPKWFGLGIAIAVGLQWWSLRYQRNKLALICGFGIALLTAALLLATKEWPGMPPMATGFFVTVPIAVVALAGWASRDLSIRRVQLFATALLFLSIAGFVLNPSGVAYALAPGGRYVLAFVPLMVSIAMLQVFRRRKQQRDAIVYRVVAVCLVAAGVMVQIGTIAGIAAPWHRTLGQLRDLIRANTEENAIIVTTQMEYPSMLATTYLDRQWYYEPPGGPPIHDVICKSGDDVWYLSKAENIPGQRATERAGSAPGGSVALANEELVVLRKRPC